MQRELKRYDENYNLVTIYNYFKYISKKEKRLDLLFIYEFFNRLKANEYKIRVLNYKTIKKIKFASKFMDEYGIIHPIKNKEKLEK